MNEIVPGIAFAPALDDADALYEQLAREIDATPEIVDFGAGPVEQQRTTSWHGDPDALYTYTGMTNLPKPWTPALARLRDRLNATLGLTLNSCLIGVYADGASMVNWHADAEPELRATIVSVSLGATRTFMLRRGLDGEAFPVPLTHGSVLTMTVESQQIWQHAVPAEPATGPRMNLTFRTVAPAATGGADSAF